MNRKLGSAVLTFVLIGVFLVAIDYSPASYEVYPDLCPYCKRPVEVVIDETHNGRNINLRLPH